MGLDDFDTTEESSSSSIKTRKQIENVELQEKFWDMLVTTYPDVMVVAARFTDESSAKAIVQKIDQALEDDVPHHSVSDDNIEMLEEVREDIIDGVLD